MNGSGEQQPHCDVFYGQVSEHLARIYVRVTGLPGAATPVIRGHVRGPTCRHSHTLPATVPLRDLGPGPTALAEALLPDPCSWSPELPALYDVQIELQTDGVSQDKLQQSLGIRRFGVVGRDLMLSGKRWVARGTNVLRREAHDLPAWRAAELVMLVDDPTDELCREASLEGVFMFARLTDAESLESELRRLARWASVGVVILPTNIALPLEGLRQVAPNLLLAGWRGALEQTNADDSLAENTYDVTFYEVDDAAKFGTWASQRQVPCCAVQRLDQPVPWNEVAEIIQHFEQGLEPNCAGWFVVQP